MLGDLPSLKTAIILLVCMTLDQIKQGLAEMPEEQLAQVVAYAVHLRHQREAAAGEDLAHRIDDHDPSHWVAIDQLREHWEK